MIAVASKILALRNGATYLKGTSEAAIASNNTKRKLFKYAEYARDTYVQAVMDQMTVEREELPTLIRSRDFYKKVLERVERSYERDARASKWLAEALPKFNL